MIIKPFKNWEDIFLDTSLIIHLFHSLKEDCKDARSLFTNRLVKYLNDNNGASNKPRNYYISSITISEIWRKTPDEKAVEIINALNSSNVNFVAFENDIAEFMNANYHSILNKDKLNEFARELSWPEHDLVMAREWIIKDTMIIASSHFYKCDVLLTLDEKTMLPIAEKVETPCAIAEEKNFEITDKFILSYRKK